MQPSEHPSGLSAQPHGSKEVLLTNVVLQIDECQLTAYVHGSVSTSGAALP